MTSRERLLGVRRLLVATFALRALLVGLAVTLATLALVRWLGVASTSSFVACAISGAVVAAWLARPALRARSAERVALWVEERTPALRYALVTAAGAVALHPDVDRQALALPWWSDARRAMARSLAWPATSALAAALLFATLPARSAMRATGARDLAPSRVASSTADVLAHLHVRVTPPAYSGRAADDRDDPTSLGGLVGSVITVRGDGDAARVSAAVDSAARPVMQRGDGWQLTLAMPVRPALVRLRARDGTSRDRLIVLAPVTDAAPAVTLLLPARDTVVRVVHGSLLLRADLRDDIGLHDARFELVISSGQEENFTFRSLVVGATALGNATARQITSTVSLDALALKPGDVLQLRAVARDGNTVTGPGVGSSETRALRVARAGEYDSVSVDPAPPGDPEGQVLSQRMLITLTEALEKRRPRLARATLLAESGRIAADQAKLRKRVGDIVFQRLGGEPLGEESNVETPGGKMTPEQLLQRAEEATRSTAGDVMDVEGDETPILALNKPLLEAFNAMWDAGRSLELGETDRALPPMRRALAAIERARQAERIYLRGRPSAVVVDVAKVRLAGKDKGASAELPARVPATPVMRVRAASFARATALLARDATAAADTLLVMRVDALEDAPALAAALDEASRAARAGNAPSTALAWERVRRALGPAPVRGDAAGLWRGSLP